MLIWDTQRSACLTLVVGDDFNAATLHDTDTGVGGSKIDTNDGAGDSIAVVLEGLLVLGVCGLSQHQPADEDEDKVESDRPCRALAGVPRASRHCVYVGCVVKPHRDWSGFNAFGGGMRASLSGSSQCGVERGKNDSGYRVKKKQRQRRITVDVRLRMEEERGGVDGQRYMAAGAPTISK